MMASISKVRGRNTKAHNIILHNANNDKNKDQKEVEELISRYEISDTKVATYKIGHFS